jgi:cytochrome c oxidase subunit 5b
VYSALCYLLILLVLLLQEAPAVIESYYNKRIVGCPGGEGGKSVLSSPFYFSKVNSWCGVKHLCNKLLGFCLSSPFFFAEDEHDVVWFWLKKDEPHECPVCSQYFVVI